MRGIDMGALINWANQNAGVLGLVFSLVVTISTVTYVILTRSLVQETKEMRKAGTDPEIAIYIQQQERWINLLDMVIRNLGNGPAYDISFQVNEKEPLHTDHNLSKILALKRGMRYLAPENEFRFYFGSAIDLLKDPIIGPIEITVTYYNRSRVKRKECFTVDITDFQGTMAVGKPPLFEMAEKLNRISTDLHNAIGSEFRLKVDVKTNKQVEQDSEKFLREAEEELKKGKQENHKNNI
jgi:hypothetical protein